MTLKNIMLPYKEKKPDTYCVMYMSTYFMKFLEKGNP